MLVTNKNLQQDYTLSFTDTDLIPGAQYRNVARYLERNENSTKTINENFKNIFWLELLKGMGNKRVERRQDWQPPSSTWYKWSLKAYEDQLEEI